MVVKFKNSSNMDTEPLKLCSQSWANGVCHFPLQTGILIGMGTGFGVMISDFGTQNYHFPKGYHHWASHFTSLSQSVTINWGKYSFVIGFYETHNNYHLLSHLVGRGNPPWALNIPACSCWLSPRCKALTPFSPGLFLLAMFPVSKLDRWGNIFPRHRVVLLQHTMKTANPPSTVFCNTAHCVQASVLGSWCHPYVTWEAWTISENQHATLANAFVMK